MATDRRPHRSEGASASSSASREATASELAPGNESRTPSERRDSEHPPRDLEHFRALLHAYMLKKGLRSTDQRRLIVETFFHSKNHVSIEELLALVRSQDARIGYATVYRTLKLLTECGIAFERHFGDGLTRYELADEGAHHDHLICVECGAIVEFEEPRIEELQEAVAAQYGFLLKSHKHEMYGICPACQSRKKGN